ncbi:hypothetical protein LR48_Vigan07g206900 [Vigna angularis]|uniref:Uncharacterized protein n=1 Tax=Phaseolus angularis TaxID=3914 RepID=A0A0L9UZS1_PHAAN|nr:hypothetical protein LR48_Vigan07g206900 [Vigna angularis]
MKQKSDSRIQLSEGSDRPHPPLPPSRHKKWKLARIRSSGSYTSHTTREISERIEITKKVRAELYDEVVEMVARQFQQRYEDYGNRPPPSPVAEHVVPPTDQEGSPTPKKTHLSEDDPFGALDKLVNIISDTPMIVPWDSTTFGREAHIPLYLHQQDVRKLASGKEEINITLIQVWMM